MNRFKFASVAAIFMLCLFLAACAEKSPKPAEPLLSDLPEPQSTSPLSESSGSVSAASESEAMEESDSETLPEPEPIRTEEIKSEAPPESGEPFTQPEPESSNPIQPELLNAVAPEQTLDREMIERELLRLINELREETGAEALGIQEDMVFAARIRSAEALQSFSHTRPNGSPYNTAFDEAEFSYAGKWHGENLASLSFTDGMLGEKSAALEMFNKLKDSPGHYRNMTSENFLQVGIGVSITFEKDMVRIASAQMFSSL